MSLDNFKATKAGVCPLWIQKIFFMDSILREPFKTDGDTDSKNIA